jgi:hypothetical protein
MDPLTLAAIGAGVGLLKSEMIDRPREQEQRRRNAEIARWSPWTGMQGEAVNPADPFGSSLTYGLTGYSLGQNIEASGKAKDAAEAAKATQATSLQGGQSIAPMTGQQFLAQQEQMPQQSMMTPQQQGYYGQYPTWNLMRRG